MKTFKNISLAFTLGFISLVRSKCVKPKSNSTCYLIDNDACAPLARINNDRNSSGMVTYGLGIGVKNNCNFSITNMHTGQILGEKDFEITPSGPSKCQDKLKVHKYEEGRFLFQFSDGNETSVLVHYYAHSDTDQDSKYTTEITGTINKTLSNPTVGSRQVYLRLDNNTKFYDVIQLRCQVYAVYGITRVRLTDGQTVINCTSMDFYLTIPNETEYEVKQSISILKYAPSTCNFVGGNKTRLKINLQINALNQVDQKENYNATAKVHRSVTNMYQRQLSISLPKDLEAFTTCLELHPNSTYVTNSTNITARYDLVKDLIEVTFDEPILKKTKINIKCHKDIPWSLEVAIQVIDSVNVGFAVIGITCAIVFCTITIFAYIIFRRKTKYPHIDDILLRSKIVVNRPESVIDQPELDKLESASHDECENTRLLEMAFGDRLHQVLKPIESLIISQAKEPLGKGEFGKVYHGIVNIGDFTQVEVAIKIAQNPENKVELIHEAKTMERVKRHQHIANLQGIAFKNDDIYLLIEYCANNNVQEYLRQNLAHYSRLAIENKNFEFLMRCGIQVASGMMYLAKNGVKHCDLAARNVLVTAELNLKITDFGLSERDYLTLTDPRVTKSGNKREPIAWLAYEVLRGKEKEYASDVWSFGVYLWEIWQLGYGHPYGHLREKGVIDLHKLLHFLDTGNRLAMPELCPDEVFQVMTQCWHLDHHSRPSFQSLKDQLEELQNKSHLKIVLVHQVEEDDDTTPCQYTPVVSPNTTETEVTSADAKSSSIRRLFKFPSMTNLPSSTLPPTHESEPGEYNCWKTARRESF